MSLWSSRRRGSHVTGSGRSRPADAGTVPAMIGSCCSLPSRSWPAPTLLLTAFARMSCGKKNKKKSKDKSGVEVEWGAWGRG